jgi:hypothetical protein
MGKDYKIGEDGDRFANLITSAAFSPNDKLLLLVVSDSNGRGVRLYECDICGSFAELSNRARKRVGRQ